MRKALDVVIGGTGRDLLDGGTGTTVDLLLGDSASQQVWAATARLRPTTPPSRPDPLHRRGRSGDRHHGRHRHGRAQLRGHHRQRHISGATGTADCVKGNAGGDILFGEAGSDLMFGDAGDDYTRGNDGDDVMRGGSENDRMWGDANEDEMFGDSGADTMRGNANNDSHARQHRRRLHGR